MMDIPERLNPLLKLEALQAADEAACRLDGMFRDIFNQEERMDLIVTIIRAATTAMLIPNNPGAALAEPLTEQPDHDGKLDRPNSGLDSRDRGQSCDCPECDPNERAERIATDLANWEI